MQLKFLEEQIGVHRKSRKALCAKQRTAKKAGREFAEADAEKLKLVTEEQSKIQKQLDQVCKNQVFKLVRSKANCNLKMQIHICSYLFHFRYASNRRSTPILLQSTEASSSNISRVQVFLPKVILARVAPLTCFQRCLVRW